MRFLLVNHLQNARQSLKSNRLRSLLTMLGITIGVASITVILSLGSGASRVVERQVDALGGNIAVVRPGVHDASLDDLSQLSKEPGFATSTLTEVDLEHIRALPDVAAAAPLIIIGGSIKGDSPASVGSTILASSPELADINGLVIRDGQFLDPELTGGTAVIGPQLSIDLFGTEGSIGKKVFLKGIPFTIIGILERADDPINYNGVDFDKSVIITQESARMLSQGSLQIQQINVKSTSVSSLGQAIIDMNKTLLRTHLNEPDFAVLSGDEIAKPTSRLFTAIAGATTAIAAISLLVGGIGIMNIMLVSVAERTREIGIRKALGASNSDIMAQFLIESLALSIGGSVSGYVLGYLIAFGISTFLTFDPSFTWEIAGIALGISLVIGTVFGLYPAIRAARKDAISALRQYD